MECPVSVPSSIQCATATSLQQALGDRHSKTHSLCFRGEETPGLSRGSQPASSPEKHLALGEFRCQNPALTGRQLQNHLRRTHHASKRAGEASGKGRLLLQSSKQKFLETKPKILSHQVFLNGSKQFSERPEKTLTQGLPDSRAATVASSVRHRPFTQAVEELTHQIQLISCRMHLSKHRETKSVDFQ